MTDDKHRHRRPRRSSTAKLTVLAVLVACGHAEPSRASAGSQPMQFQSVRHVTITIHCAPERVYDFVSDPRNLPAWASGLSTSIENVDGRWVADSPLGRVSIRFAPRNELGVLDHDVTLESGVTVHNPMRVLPNPSGRGATTTGEAARAPRGSPHTENGKTSEVVFTLFRLPGVSDAKFERDARTVTGDLEVLKRTLEREATTR